jgi:hypothetical protein
MPKTIDDLLQEIGEDKHENLSTTSFLFKKDLWEFFQGFQNKNCVEFGTHKGQTTRILANLFKKVYTINLPGHFDLARQLNVDLDNIEYVGLNLYQTPADKNFKHDKIAMAFIDANHSFDCVMFDFTRVLNFKLDDEVYVVFDDYGMHNDVYVAVEQLIRVGQLEKVKYIGHPPRHNFGGSPARILDNPEGVICKLIR